MVGGGCGTSIEGGFAADRKEGELAGAIGDVDCASGWRCVITMVIKV